MPRKSRSYEIKPKAALESSIEGPAKDLARRLGFWVRKFVSPAHRSVPDDVFAKNGRVFWIEFKRPGEDLTPNQESEHIEMRAAGLDVYTADSLELAKLIFSLYS